MLMPYPKEWIFLCVCVCLDIMYIFPSDKEEGEALS